MAKSSKAKDVFIRALKTFWQASLSYVIINIQTIVDAITTDLEVGGFETLKSVGITIGLGALAAGLSALYNGVIKEALSKQKQDDYSDNEMGLMPELEDETLESADQLDLGEDDEVGLEADAASADDVNDEVASDAVADGVND